MGRRVSDGQSVKVAVPASTTITQGQFALLGGVLGMAVQGIITNADGLVTSINGNTVPAGLVPAEVVLAIDDMEVETSQIDTDDDFAAGDKVYWDAVNVRFTTTAGAGPYAGVVTVAKDANDVIWFRFLPLQRSVETDVVGELDNLTTTAKGSCVAAINEVDAHADTAQASVGVLANLTTAEKGSAVGAVNEVDSHADAAQADADTAQAAADAAQGDADTALAGIGTLANLTTDVKTDLVAAINEVDGHADAAQSDADDALAAAGTLANLTTEVKTDLVGAVNEVDAHADAAQGDADDALANIGMLANLTTDVKTDLVSAVNEVDGHADTALARVAAHQADSTAVQLADLVTDFNDLLAALEAAGLIAAP